MYTIRICLPLWCIAFFAAVTVRAQERAYMPGTPDNSPLSNYHLDKTAIRDWIFQGNQLIYQYPDSAALLYKKALDYSLLNRYYSGVCKALINIGSCYGVKNDYRQAIFIYRKTLPYFALSLGVDKQVFVDFNTNMGVAYYHLGMTDSALVYLFNGLGIAKRIRDTTRMIHIYANISGIQNNASLHRKALQYAQNAVELSLRKGDSSALSQLYGIIASASKGLGKMDESLRYMHLALLTARETHHHNNVLAKMGEIYLANHMPDSAIFYLNKWLDIARETNAAVSLDIYSNLGIAHHMLGENRKALDYMRRALRTATHPDRNDTIKTVNLTVTWYVMAEILRDMGRYREALGYLFPYIDLRDSLLSAERNAAVDSLEVKFRTAEKDRDIASKLLLLAKEQQKVTQRNIWLGLALCVLVVLLTISFITYYHLRNKQKTQLRLLQQEKEINVLKATIKGEERERTRLAYELHDGIGGMLAAIKMNFGAVKQRYEYLYDLKELTSLMNMLEDTTDELRKTAHNLMPGILASHSLAEALQIWCSNINATGKLHISLRVTGMDAPLPKDLELMLYRMIQELVQNIIKHARATKAEVDLAHRDGEIHIFVEDDGDGFADTDRNGGFGLQNLRYRVQALQGEMYIDTEAGKGTAVSIRFDDNRIKMAFAS